MSLLSHFIVFEGLDGSGKSTQARRLASSLASQGKAVRLTSEPTDNPIGRLVRDVLQHRVVTSSKALALLYAADREDHLSNPGYGILKSLDEGQVVIGDRYLHSSLAYQGVSEDMDFLKTINDFPLPGHIIFIDTPVEECMRRIEARGDEKELFDKLEYLKAVRSAFLEVFATLPPGVRYLRVDGMLDADSQARQVEAFLTL